MILPKGITGFTSIQDYFEVPNVSKDIVIDATEKFIANNSEFIIINFFEPAQNSNYFLLNLKNTFNGKNVTIIFNSHYRYFSGVEKEISWCERIFCDLSISITSIYESFGFIYLSKQILESKATSKEISLLANSEKEQIEYWESVKLGEIIYNNYD